MKKLTFCSGMLVLMLTAVSVANAHCEVPCGIYDDAMRADLIAEHTRTIQKSMVSIEELKAEKDKNYNQLVRWINNKEEHARKLQEIVWQYFMTQRIQPVEEGTEGREKYVHETTLLQQMLVQAMKCKQTTDLEHTEELSRLLEEFKKSYFTESDHRHEDMHEGHSH